MTLVITWSHVGVMVGVLTAIGGFIAWLINRFDTAREKERLELVKEINEANEQQNIQRTAIAFEVNKLQKVEETQWDKIDKISKEVALCVSREELSQSRREMTGAINEMRISLAQQFTDGFNSLSARMDRFSDRKQ